MNLFLKKLFSILAFSGFALAVASTSTFAGIKESQIKTGNGIVFETPECPEGEEWNEETKLCEKKK